MPLGSEMEEEEVGRTGAEMPSSVVVVVVLPVAGGLVGLTILVVVLVWGLDWDWVCVMMTVTMMVDGVGAETMLVEVVVIVVMTGALGTPRRKGYASLARLPSRDDYA